MSETINEGNSLENLEAPKALLEMSFQSEKMIAILGGEFQGDSQISNLNHEPNALFERTIFEIIGETEAYFGDKNACKTVIEILLQEKNNFLKYVSKFFSSEQYPRSRRENFSFFNEAVKRLMQRSAARVRASFPAEIIDIHQRRKPENDSTIDFYPLSREDCKQLFVAIVGYIAEKNELYDDTGFQIQIPEDIRPYIMWLRISERNTGYPQLSQQIHSAVLVLLRHNFPRVKKEIFDALSGKIEKSPLRMYSAPQEQVSSCTQAQNTQNKKVPVFYFELSPDALEKMEYCIVGKEYETYFFTEVFGIEVPQSEHIRHMGNSSGEYIFIRIPPHNIEVKVKKSDYLKYFHYKGISRR